MTKKQKVDISKLVPVSGLPLQQLLRDFSSLVPAEAFQELSTAMKQQNNYLNMLFDTLRSIGLFINDVENNEVYPNQYWYDWGYSEEEMKNLGFLKFVHPDDLQYALNQSIKPVKNGSADNKILFRFLTKTGEWRWVLSSAVSILTDSKGNVKQYIGFDYDITEEMEAKRNLEMALLAAREAQKAAEMSALEANTIQEVSAIITSTLDLNETLEAILKEAKRVIPFDSASVQILKDSRLEIIGGTGWQQEDSIIGFSFPVPGDNPNTVVMETREPFSIKNITDDTRYCGNFPKAYKGKSWLGLPLLMRNTVMGMMTFDKKEENFFTDDHQRIGKAFASHVAIALENSRIYEELKKRAMTDPLTGVINRRVFFDLAKQQEKLFRRYGTVFSLIMVDIDLFKHVNDTFGHQKGDSILQDVASLIKENLRESDILCRYGGEEFVVLLPQSDEQDAYDSAERIRRAVKNRVGIVTVSLGCADIKLSQEKTIGALISMADKALYKAKHDGRNTSCKYSSLSV